MEGLLRARLAAERLRIWFATQASEPSEEPATTATPPARGSRSARRAPTPPEGVAIEALVAALDLSIATFSAASQPAGTLGYLEPGEDLIFVRAGLTQAVRRFTLAHELGHAVLHRPGSAAALAAGLGQDASSAPSRCDTSDLAVPFDLISASDEQLTPGEAYSARSTREAEANAFAAALLLPTDALLAAYLAPTRPSIRTLATRFGVSEDTLLRRLTALLAPGAEEGSATPQPRPMGEGSESTPTTGARPQLDDCQVEAARAATPALVIAGPGTGKTSTLVERVEYLVCERGVPAEAVLALTFSHKAARELRERVAARLGGKAASAMVREGEWVAQEPSLPTVSTIHTFCGALLRRYAPLVGLRPDFRLVTEAEGYFLLRQLAPPLSLPYYQPVAAPARYYPDLLAAISRAKDELVGPEEYATLAERMAERAVLPEERDAAARAGEVAAVYAAYQRGLEAQGDPDFGDVVRLTVRLLVEHPEVLAQVRAQYREVLVDEFQDINRAMGVLLRTLCGEDGPLWAVGDPDQAIYRFRGASPANIARFTDEYPTSTRYTLDRNHRSTPPILGAAAAVAQAFLGSERPPLQATRALARTPTVTFAVAADEAAEWAGIAEALRAHQAAGYSLSDQAVLCRTRRQAQRVASALEAEGIPTRTLAPLLEQPDVLRLLAVVNLLAERSGAGLLRAGELAPHAFSVADARTLLAEAQTRKVAPNTLLAKADSIPGISPAGARGFAALAHILVTLRSAPDTATGLARYVFRLTDLGRSLLGGLAAGDPAAAEGAQHIGRLLALAHSFDEARRDGERGRRARAAWGEFQDYIRVLLLLRQERGGADDLVPSADAGVWVLTVHASKGLEFPVVYLPGLAARRFPIQRQAETVPLPPGMAGDASLVGAGDPHTAEEASLLYVALTRARDALVLSFAERYGALRSSASPFLPPVAHALGTDLGRVRWQGRGVRQEALRAMGTEDEDGGEVAPNGASMAAATPTTDAASPISVSALETYLRCPRQYAYRHVYGLQPSDNGARALRHAMRATLRALDGASETPGEGETSPAEHGARPTTLAEVRALFDAHWAEQTGAASANTSQAPTEASDTGTEGTPAERAFESVYQRYGHQMIERAWQVLASEGHEGATVKPAFDEEVRVRVGGGEVLLPIDRIERVVPQNEWVTTPQRASEAAASGGEGGHAPSETSTRAHRLIRQRTGRAENHSDERPDVRALLYHLAAQQEARGESAAPVYAEYLESGEVERVSLSPRQIERLRADVERALEGIAARSFPARRNAFTCAGCQFALICPA